jgi:hypothetical protein
LVLLCLKQTHVFEIVVYQMMIFAWGALGT